MQTGNCFRCRKAGHWISDCPLKSNADDPPPSIHCHCGGGFCEIKAQNCKFFKWCDKVTDEDIRFRPAFIIPICPCGSGPCRRVTVDSGRSYLIYCIKKGFGACGFFQWEDDIPTSCDAMDEIDFWVQADLISTHVESSFHASVPDNVNSGKECQGSVSVDSIFENLDDAMFVNDIHSAAVNQGIPLFNPIVIEPEERCAKTLNSDQSTSSALSKSSFKESCHLNVDEAMSYLVRDTVSSGSVVTNHEQPVCGTGEAEWPFSNLQVKTLHGDQSTNCALSKSSFKESFQLNVDEAMSDLVRDTVSSGSVATSHKRPVSGTSEAEWSFPNLQDLMEQYNSEKLQLESVSGKHVQVLSAFMGSFGRLRSLHEEACRFRKRLLETEKEMACCEAETLEFGASCREVAGEMAESQKRMQETAEKLGKEVEVLKQNEFVAMKRRRC